ncbi:MAG: Gfo/Idh/MocA family oxidoreductase [Anaerolineae bacterium]
MNFVLLGAGSIGVRHIKNLIGMGHHISLVYDPNPMKAVEIRQLIPTSRVTSEEAEALATPCDAILICSPTADHLRQVEAALKNGRDIFVEKPLSHTLTGTTEVASFADQTSRVVLVGCNLRFFPSLGRVKQLIQDGAVGQPLAARVYGGFYLPYWRPHTDYRQGYAAQAKMGGGVILDFIHELDYMRWLFGEPMEVMAMTGKLSQLEMDTEDLAVALMRYKSGLIAELHLDYLQPTYRRGLEIYGEAHTIIWDYIDQSIRLYTPKNNTYQVYQEHINTERNLMYLLEMEHFEKCLRREVTPEQNLWEARATLELATAIKLAALTKQSVSLPLTGDGNV